MYRTSNLAEYKALCIGDRRMVYNFNNFAAGEVANTDWTLTFTTSSMKVVTFEVKFLNIRNVWDIRTLQVIVLPSG